MTKEKSPPFKLFRFPPTAVMPELVPGIHVFLASGNKDVDGRDKPGHDGGEGTEGAGRAEWARRAEKHG